MRSESVRRRARLAWVALGVVVLLVVVWLGVRAAGREETGRLLVAWVGHRMGVQVSYQRLSVRPLKGVEVTGLELGGAGAWLSAGKVVVRPEWREVLAGRMKIVRLVVEDWNLVLGPGRGPASSSPIPTLEVGDFTLSDGAVFWRGDHQASVKVARAGGMVRWTPLERVVRLDEAVVTVQGSLDARLDGSLLQLADGAWEAEFRVASAAGRAQVKAVRDVAGWSWWVDGEELDLATWAGLLDHPPPVAGSARVTAVGKHGEGEAQVRVGMARWGSLAADEVEGHLSWTGPLVRIRRLSLARQGSRVTGWGEVRRGPPLSWDLTLRPWPVEVEVGALPLGMRGTVRTRGALAPEGPQVRVLLSEGSVGWGQWQAGGLEGELEWTGGVARVSRLVLREGMVRGEVRGTLSRQAVDLVHRVVVLQPPGREGLVFPLTGVLKVEGRLVGAWGSPVWRGMAEGWDLRARDGAVSRALFAGEAGLGESGWFVRGNLELTGARRGALKPLHMVRARLDATAERWLVPEAVVVGPEGTMVSLGGTFQGSHGCLTSLAVLSQRGALAMLGKAPFSLQGNAVTVKELRLATSGGGFLELSDATFGPGGAQGRVSVLHFPVGLITPLVRLEGTYAGRLYATVQTSQRTDAWVSLRGLARLPAMAGFPVDADLRLSRWDGTTVVHGAEVRQGDLSVEGAWVLDRLGRIKGRVTTTGAPVRKLVLLADELFHAGLRPLFDAYSGTLQADVSVDGSLPQPLISGSLTVDGGAEVMVKPLRTKYTGIRGRGRWEDACVVIDSLQGQAGRGQARMQGRLCLPSLVLSEASFRVVAKRHEFRVIPGIRGLCDANLTLFKRGKGLGMEGEVTVTEGFIDLPLLPTEPVPPTEAGLDDHWLVSITAQRGVWVRDRFLNAEVGGRLFLTKEEGVVSLQGELEVLRGTYLYLGRRFALTQGRVTFLGGPVIVPELDVTATTVVRSGQRDGDEITLVLTVRGPVTGPQLVVSAEDQDYSQEQLMTMLLFNLTPEELMMLWQGDAFAKEAAGAVEEFLTGELVRVLRAETGLDELELRTSLLSTEERDLHVRMGKYLTPELFVAVGKGLRSYGLDEVRVEYLLDRLARRLGLGRQVDLKLVGERTEDEFSRPNYHVQVRVKYRF